MKILSKRSKLFGTIVLSMLLLSTYASVSLSKEMSNIENFSSQEPPNSRDEYTHTVLVEGCTWTQCSPCVTAAYHIMNLYESGLYDFYYVANVYPSNNPYTNIRENELGHTGYYPDYYFDGGYTHYIGSSGLPNAYITRLNLCGARDVADIDLDLNITWEGDAQIGVTLDIMNNEVTSYNGHVHVYVTEITSRWTMVNGQPYHYAWIGDWAINEDVSVLGSDTTQLTTVWDGNDYGFGNIQEQNIQIVASVFQSGNEYTDETAMANFETELGPDPPSQPEGLTEGEVGMIYFYSTSASDPNGDPVYYQWYWGDEVSEWLGPYPSGDTIEFNHTFVIGGTHDVKVRAKDDSDIISEYSTSLPVTISGPRLEIGDIRGTFLGLSAEIMNTGTWATEDVNYSISVRGGLFNKINYTKEGSIALLDEDDERTKTAKPILGIGSIEIVVQAEALYGGSVEKRLTGKALFFIIQIDDEE